MSKGLSSFLAERRLSIAMRRTQKPKEKGNGYWAAVGYLEKVKAPKPKQNKSKEIV